MKLGNNEYSDLIEAHSVSLKALAAEGDRLSHGEVGRIPMLNGENRRNSLTPF